VRRAALVRTAARPQSRGGGAMTQPSVDLLLLTERVSELEDTVLAQAAVLHMQETKLKRHAREIARLQQQVLAGRGHVGNMDTDRFLDRLDAAFALAIGVGTLPPADSQHLRAAFVARIADRHTDPEAHIVFLMRYKANDDTLIDDFVKNYIINGEWLVRLLKELNDPD